MDARWVKNLKGDDKENFKQMLLNSDTLLERLAVVLEELKKKETRQDYRESGWPYLRAYDDGFNEAIKSVIDLITIKKED